MTGPDKKFDSKVKECITIFWFLGGVENISKSDPITVSKIDLDDDIQYLTQHGVSVVNL